jgi:predicted phage terminase large subunit-like protein
MQRTERLETVLALAEKRTADASTRSKWQAASVDELQSVLATVRERRRRKEKIPDDEDQAVTVLCERDLSVFCTEAWRHVETAALNWSWHHVQVSKALQATTHRHIKRLAINMPPRHTKSSIVAVLWPGWVWASDPTETFLSTSHSHDLATRDAAASRRLVEGNWYRRRWGTTVRIAPDEAAKERYKLVSGGHRIAGSPSGVSTGDGGDVLIADDLLRISDRFSEPIRRGVNDWFKETFMSRLNDPERGVIVCVGQRLHERDIFGEILAEGGWTHLNFTEEFESAHRCVVSVPGFSYADPRETEGELLWPTRFGPQQVEAIKRSNTASGYSALYQQRPTPQGGGRFKEEWFRDFEIRDTSEGRDYFLFDPSGVRVVKGSACKLFGPVDPASAEKTQGTRPCFTVMIAMAATGQKDVLLFDLWRRNAPAPEVLDAMEDFKGRNRLDFLLAEKNGLGLPIFQMAVAKGIVVKGVEAAGSKESRAEAAEIHARNGKVYILRNAPWRNEFLRELELFPAGEFADQVDAFSHGVRHVATELWTGGDIYWPDDMELSTPEVKAMRKVLDGFA